MTTDRTTSAWLRPILGSVRGMLAELLTLSFFVNVLALAVPIFVLQVYDRVVSQNGLTTLQGLLIGVLIAIVFDFVLRQTRSRLLQRMAMRYDVEVGRALFEKVQRLPLRTLEARPAAFWQMLFRDVEVLRNTVAGPPAILLVDLPFAILFIAIIYVVAAPIIWVLFAILPLFVLLALRSGSAVRAAADAERDATVDRDSLVSDIIGNRTTIKALALDEAMQPLWEDRHASTIERAVTRGRRADGYHNLGLSLSILTTVAITSVGALAIMEQALTIGALIATNMLSNRIVGPFTQLVTTWRGIVSFRQSLKRLREAFDLVEEPAHDSVEMPTPKGDLEADAVVFAYGPNTAPVLDRISFRVGPGGLHAIVGRNGSGKTTLMKIMHGLYAPAGGRMLLDGADIGQFSRRRLAHWIGYVPQDTVLLSASIRENIAKGWEGIGDDDVLRAARAAGAHDFIVDLPEGYGAQVGEGGGRLSGGQRQRIAIARALVGQPAILLLDEPSASLDRQAEEDLRDTLIDLAREHTVVVVTHSAILLPACHNIMVLDQGRIVMGGPTAQMLPRLFGKAEQPAVLERKA